MSVVSTRFGRMQIIDADKIISRALALYGEWAMDELGLLAQLITPGMCVLDVGAFIGTHTLAFSEFTGQKGKVYSFEPRKEIYDILSANIDLNDCQNVTTRNMGLAEAERTIELQSININEGINFGGLALAVNESSLISNTYKVRVSTIDGLEIEKIDVIKLDVEGMERRVLDGAIETISRDRPLVFCECNSLSDGNEILEFCQVHHLDTFGFLASAYNPDNFNAINENIFGSAKEFALVLIPREKTAETLQKITVEGLFSLYSLEDLVLPLLHKPQYAFEVLAHTASCSLLGIEYHTPAVAKSDEQIANLNESITARDGQIANLNESITARDGQIADLSQSITARDGQIANLNHAIAERSTDTISLDPALAKPDGKMAILQQRQNELQVLYNELRNENRAYRLSTSWRITRPLRQISQCRQQAGRFIRLYKRHRQANPGIDGFWRLVRRGVDIARKGDLTKGLQTSAAIYERSLSTALQAPSSSVLVFGDIADKTVKLPKNIAVHAHIYYSDLATEIRSYLENIPIKFKLYVTTDTREKAKLVKEAFSNLKNMLALDIRIVENRGRDIFPMLATLGAELAEHEIVLHIHTKRSPHNTWEFGGWRRYLMESLLGSPLRVTAILEQFVKNKDLGILFPDPYHPVKRLVHMRTSANSSNIAKLLNRAGTVKAEAGEIDLNYFPAGNMFWFRGEAIKSLVGMKLSEKDFEPEEGQVDATLAHAIERMFPYFAGEMGLTTKSYLPNSFLSQQCSANRMDLFYTYLENRLILNPTIIFDHNGGGGSNSYTRELVKSILADGGSVLRVYCFDAIWFVQWIGDDDGMLFYTSSIEELFESLSVSRGTSIVLNSLYGYPDIKVAASNIVGLARSLSATLDFKIHDFYALCSSPHLSDFEGKYCGVPQDPAVCGRCLKKNVGWYHNWYPMENRPVDIAEWRKPFVELFEAANTVTFFDPSSVEIVRKAFSLKDSKVKVIPHAINYFKCDTPSDITGPLQIGVLGTLSKGKGGDVVKALYEYMESQNIYEHIPITLVGSSVVELPRYLSVHGNYTPNDLPIIIGKRGINVILMPSIIPETFSYTISEAMQMGLPIVALSARPKPITCSTGSFRRP